MKPFSHRLLPGLLVCLYRLLKDLQIIRYRVAQRIIVLTGGLIDIPMHTVAAVPDMRIDTVAEVWVVRLLLSQQIRKAQAQDVHLSLIAVEDRQLQRVIMIGDDAGDELYFCAVCIAETNIAGASDISRVRIPITHDLFEFLLVKIYVVPPFTA